METNNPAIAIAILAFLGTALLAAAISLYAAWRAIRDDTVRAGRALGAVCLLLAAYGIALGVGGIFGRERIVPVGGEKYFCEIDCHLAYSVPRLEAVGTDGATGTNLWLLTVRTRFDPATISPRRPLTAPTWPAPRLVALVDATGREFTPLPEDAAEASPLLAGSIPMSQPLAPGEAYQSRFVFRLPSDAVPSRLLLQDDIFISQLLIGNERSPFHRPVYLALPMKG
jgi:hypothetical protein